MTAAGKRLNSRRSISVEKQRDLWRKGLGGCNCVAAAKVCGSSEKGWLTRDSNSAAAVVYVFTVDDQNWGLRRIGEQGRRNLGGRFSRVSAA